MRDGRRLWWRAVFGALLAVMVAGGCSKASTGGASAGRDHDRAATTTSPATTVPTPTTAPPTIQPAATIAVTTTLATTAAGQSRYADSFETGALDGQRWRDAGAVVIAGAAHGGRFGVRLTSNGSGAYLNLAADSLQPLQRSFRFDGWFRVVNRSPGDAVALVTIHNDVGVNNADLFVDGATGLCRADLAGTDLAVSTGPCSDGVWHEVALRGDFGSSTYTLTWTVDGLAQQPVTSVRMSPSAVKSLWLGGLSSKTNVVDWDDVALVLSSAPST
jgi:hypothetical protein